MKNAHYFVDADNIPNRQIPGAAISALSEMTNTCPRTATIAGVTESRNRSWASVLTAHHAKAVESLKVQQKEQAADVALILAMGRRYGQMDSGEVVFVLSADKLILQAAEQLSGQGLTVYAVVFGNVLQSTDLSIHKIQLSTQALGPVTKDKAEALPSRLPSVARIFLDDQELAGEVLRGFFQKHPEKLGGSVTKSDLGNYMFEVLQIGKGQRAQLFPLLGMDKVSAKVFLPKDFPTLSLPEPSSGVSNENANKINS